ncbi:MULTISPECIES: HamA C-terminal domain-containing protein [Acinetobacter calcoaceticus/baumannii complex]|uniref:HamA C-terminal domain-containing protein n=1 Tax=Acinetobacter calcoaceticus/baumannii complex TaxID=909768 RepID=UPI000BF8D7F1|nr:Hachiman antiphage defense system protein HamA [Acinetobacter baumannii]
MNPGLTSDFRIESVYLIETILNNDSTERGTCFAISKDLLITANHVVSKSKDIKIFISSDDYHNNKYITGEYLYGNESLDVAIIKIMEYEVPHFIDLYATSVNIDNLVSSCGYPVEKEHYFSPITVAITNTFEHMSSKEYSFEISQSPTITNYKGMSGAPILHKGICIGILVVQQGTNTLYAISIKDLISNSDIYEIITSRSIEIKIQEGINYKAPAHPISPFQYCINCNSDHPGIKGIDIGFTFKTWNISNFTEAVYGWIVDYCLTFKEQSNFVGKNERTLFKFARTKYPADDLDALGDLCLHIAIRESYKTIPIMSKVFDIHNRTFSCTHVVLNFDSIELWIGASSVSTNIEEAIKSAASNIEYIMDITSLNNRLFTLTNEIDESWPHQDKLKRLADSTLEIDERFDKIIVPVFVMHDSDLIKNYDKNTFINLFNEHIQECRSHIKNHVNNQIIDLIDLRVFCFPVLNSTALNEALVEELNS